MASLPDARNLFDETSAHDDPPYYHDFMKNIISEGGGQGYDADETQSQIDRAQDEGAKDIGGHGNQETTAAKASNGMKACIEKRKKMSYTLRRSHCLSMSSLNKPINKRGGDKDSYGSIHQR